MNWPDSLDAFLRFLLMHLIFFRGMVDHPGFSWRPTVLPTVRYLWTVAIPTGESSVPAVRPSPPLVRYEAKMGGPPEATFIDVSEGQTAEFLNVDQIARIEVFHPFDGSQGSGIVFMRDGTKRPLGENGINTMMRVMGGFLGRPLG